MIETRNGTPRRMPELLRNAHARGGARHAATHRIGGLGRRSGVDRSGLFVLRRNNRLCRQKDLAKEISAQLEKQVGRAPQSVDCADNLKGEVGATTRCTLTDAGETYGVNVNVTKVDGTDVKFDLKVDDQPQ